MTTNLFDFYTHMYTAYFIDKKITSEMMLGNIALFLKYVHPDLEVNCKEEDLDEVIRSVENLKLQKSKRKYIVEWLVKHNLTSKHIESSIFDGYRETLGDEHCQSLFDYAVYGSNYYIPEDVLYNEHFRNFLKKDFHNIPKKTQEKFIKRLSGETRVQ